jgi:hypothetical protein
LIPATLSHLVCWFVNWRWDKTYADVIATRLLLQIGIKFGSMVRLLVVINDYGGGSESPRECRERKCELILIVPISISGDYPPIGWSSQFFQWLLIFAFNWNGQTYLTTKWFEISGNILKGIDKLSYQLLFHLNRQLRTRLSEGIGVIHWMWAFPWWFSQLFCSEDFQSVWWGPVQLSVVCLNIVQIVCKTVGVRNSLFCIPNFNDISLPWQCEFIECYLIHNCHTFPSHQQS